METSEKFCLRWNEFETNISSAFRELREEKDFFDVTLACDDSQIQAHKVILSACSPFFRNVLRRNPHQHPLLYLKGVSYNELLSVLNFMYLGEVNVAQEELNSFLTVAEDLRVKGLTQGSSGGGETLKRGQPLQPLQPGVESKQVTAPQSKRARPSPSPGSVHQFQPSAGLSSHQPYRSTEEEEIQELVPVKVEPREAQYHHQDQQGGGAVALAESYDGEEQYEYGQYEEAYEEGVDQGQLGLSLPSVGPDGSKDLENMILSKMSKTAAGDWQCDDCYKTSKVKTNIFEHIEANHVDSPGYQCELCFKFCRTRNALRNHKNFKHKQIKKLVN